MLSDKLIQNPYVPISASEKTSIEILNLLEQRAKENGINTPLRIAHFLGQLAHESAWFKYTNENLNYSSKALNVIFRKYFPTEELAQQYARQPEKIANRLYANRMGNGDEASGDGWKYSGRGLIQLTGKKNYQNYSEYRDIDFVNNPEWVATQEWAVDSAMLYWNKRNLNSYADKDDVRSITKKINRGYNGLENREKCVQIFKEILCD